MIKQQVIKDKGGILELKYFKNGLQQIPSAVYITIYDNKGTEKVAETLAEVRLDGTMEYLVEDVLCDEIYYNWKIEWKFYIDGQETYEVQLFDIVLYKLNNPVSDYDILQRAPFLRELNYRRIETADSGTQNTIVCSQLNEVDDYWTGGWIEIIEGINVGEKRQVSDFVQSTNTLTVSNIFTNAIDNDVKFVLIRSFTKEIDEAFNIFLNDLHNKLIKSNRIIGAEQIKEPVVLKTLELICFNFSKDPVDLWFERGKMYKDDYNRRINSAMFDFDDDDSGNIDDEEGLSVGQVSGVR